MYAGQGVEGIYTRRIVRPLSTVSVSAVRTVRTGGGGLLGRRRHCVAMAMHHLKLASFGKSTELHLYACKHRATPSTEKGRVQHFQPRRLPIGPFQGVATAHSLSHVRHAQVKLPPRLAPRGLGDPSANISSTRADHDVLAPPGPEHTAR